MIFHACYEAVYTFVNKISPQVASIRRAYDMPAARRPTEKIIGHD